MLFALSLVLWWSRHRAAALWLMLAALGWTALVGWLPLPEALLRELENRHPAPVDVAAGQLQAYTGVMVLGGSPERLKASVTLLRQHPHLRLLFTGGGGKWWASGPTEADQVEAFYKRMGVSADRLAYEHASRTTYDNAVEWVCKTRPCASRTGAKSYENNSDKSRICAPRRISHFRPGARITRA